MDIQFRFPFTGGGEDIDPNIPPESTRGGRADPVSDPFPPFGGGKAPPAISPGEAATLATPGIEWSRVAMTEGPEGSSPLKWLTDPSGDTPLPMAVVSPDHRMITSPNRSEPIRFEPVGGRGPEGMIRLTSEDKGTLGKLERTIALLRDRSPVLATRHILEPTEGRTPESPDNLREEVERVREVPRGRLWRMLGQIEGRGFVVEVSDGDGGRLRVDGRSGEDDFYRLQELQNGSGRLTAGGYVGSAPMIQSLIAACRKAAGASMTALYEPGVAASAAVREALAKARSPMTTLHVSGRGGTAASSDSMLEMSILAMVQAERSARLDGESPSCAGALDSALWHWRQRSAEKAFGRGPVREGFMEEVRLALDPTGWELMNMIAQGGFETGLSDGAGKCLNLVGMQDGGVGHYWEITPDPNGAGRVLVADGASARLGRSAVEARAREVFNRAVVAIHGSVRVVGKPKSPGRWGSAGNRVGETPDISGLSI